VRDHCASRLDGLAFDWFDTGSDHCRRDPADATDTAEPRLLLTLTPPTGMVTEVVTAHPVNYFGPAPNAITSVHIACDGQDITNITVAAQ
jgi:hypothetical protein